ncbi:ICA1 [Bugula neritina]|uniref:ICA1 n=1 Tax=Bugula neritina TaxID=10212 RepID=A0A7J7KKE1_BUGNE|nr:ICA1 [Bugula neritina]
MDRGYSTHSRHMTESLQRDDKPVLTQLKKAYWTTKQQIRKTIGKKEDEHITASDAELDAKLELFKQIQLSCIDLLKVILLYQKRLLVLAREENSMGKFLRIQGEEDTTQAGKMMLAVGKSLAFSAQHRIQLRLPLFRLFQEVETFRTQAISDTQLTVVKMEEARTEYRGALLWMKDVSTRLDPDAYNRLEKFRRVQAQVRKAKEVFDKHKLDVLQKVDLLAASRGNMFSHALAAYQNTLLSFWKKTSKTMSAVSETFKGFQYYEFNMLKVSQYYEFNMLKVSQYYEFNMLKVSQYYEFNMLKGDLDEATKELARETASERSVELLESLLRDTGHNPTSEEDKLVYDIIMSLQDKQDVTQVTLAKPAETAADDLAARNTLAAAREDSCDSVTGLLEFDDAELDKEDAKVDEQFGEFQAALGIDTKHLNFSGKGSSDKYSALRQADEDLLLSDIFGPDLPPVQSAVEEFSLASGLSPPTLAPVNGDGSSTALPHGFMPSDLLDSADLSSLTLNDNFSMMSGEAAASSHPRDSGIQPPSYSQQPFNFFGATQPSAMTQPSPSPASLPSATHKTLTTSASQSSISTTSSGPSASLSAGKTPMSTWYNLFADLDPLQDPDAIGRKKDAVYDGCA